MHTLLRAPFLPYDYLVDLWNDLHLTWNLNIQNLDLDNYSPEQCAGYVVAQYISKNQGTSYLYSSQSKNWVFPGANLLWEQLKKTHLKNQNEYVQYSIGSKNSNIVLWAHPYHTGEQLSYEYQLLIEEWQSEIQKSIQQDDYRFPPANRKPNDLTDAELQTLELDVLNTLYKSSRINPSVSMNPKKPNVYHSFVEKRLEKRHIPKPKQEELDKFYKVGDYIEYDD